MIRAFIILTTILSLGILAIACGNENTSEPTSSEPASTEPEPAAKAIPAEAPAPAEAAASGCAKVKSCCAALPAEFGGGAKTNCENTANGGVEEACNAYLTTNKQINEAEGHPLKGQMPAPCMP